MGAGTRGPPHGERLTWNEVRGRKLKLPPAGMRLRWSYPLVEVGCGSGSEGTPWPGCHNNSAGASGGRLFEAYF